MDMINNQAQHQNQLTQGQQLTRYMEHREAQSPPSVVQRLERSALALRAHLVDLHQLYDTTKDEDLLVQQADISRRYTQVLGQLCDALRPPKP